MGEGSPVGRESRLGGGGGDGDHLFMAEDKERWAIGGDGLSFTPMPNRPEHGHSAPRKPVAAFDSPHSIRIFLHHGGAYLDEPLAGFLQPGQPALFLQILDQQLAEGPEKADVIQGVFGHPFGQRPDGPVRFSGSLFEMDSEQLAGERDESKLGTAEQTRGDHGVDGRLGHEARRSVQQSQIVIAPVEYQGSIAQAVPKRAQVAWRERVHQLRAVLNGDLDQTKLFGIRV